MVLQSDATTADDGDVKCAGGRHDAAQYGGPTRKGKSVKAELGLCRQEFPGFGLTGMKCEANAPAKSQAIAQSPGRL